METYIVESYRPRLLGGCVAELEARAHAAAAAVSRPGGIVRYLRCIVVPDDETCFHLFDAESPEAVLEAARRAGLTDPRVHPALTS